MRVVCVCVCACARRLSSAVAEHRRSVRPSRRTQSSRNPLRVLAARNDIVQDFMQAHDDPEAMETNKGESREPGHSDKCVQLQIKTADVIHALNKSVASSFPSLFCTEMPNDCRLVDYTLSCIFSFS